MGKIIWMSDIHLNFVGAGRGVPMNDLLAFYTELKEADGDALLITGDIAESHNVVPTLQQMSEHVGKPIYFVLGNHDFYGSSVRAVRESVQNIGPDVHYIPAAPIKLSSEAILIGVDSWGDCRNGDYKNSRITMSDWLYIEELNAGYRVGMAELKKAIQKLADADARQLARNVKAAVKSGYKHIIIATHVPPFANACFNAGRKSTDAGLCFWSSQILGTKIKPIAEKHSDVKFTWYCGHTHSGVTLNVLKNLVVHVAGAEYYCPQIAGEIEYV